MRLSWRAPRLGSHSRGVTQRDTKVLIQKLRLQRGWSQEQLADVSGLSVRTVQRIEGGQSASLESLKALAAAFGVDFSTLKEPDMNAAQASTQTPAPEAVPADEVLALAHVRKLKGFYGHATTYVVVIAFLCVVNFVTSPQYVWAIWPALGWGVGLALHGLRVFDFIPWLSADWERRAVERRLGRRL